MKIAIIGYGFVGKALKYGLKKNTEIFLVDPILKTHIKDLENFIPDIIFICVPTPMNDDGSQDVSILNSVFSEIKELKSSALIVLKSTVLPNYINDLENLISDIVYNPEFLRERYANEDFINSDLIVFGGKDKEIKRLAEFYDNHTNCINSEYKYTDIITASLIKYSINTFLSTKVVFFNELYRIFEKSGAADNWDNFITMISTDKRIGNSHMQVPGPDGMLGFGGPCLPKDCNALYTYSKNIGEPFKLLNNANSINNIIRKKYNSISDRELDQNINFDIDLDSKS